jgi:hypothetical protein
MKHLSLLASALLVFAQLCIAQSLEFSYQGEKITKDKPKKSADTITIPVLDYQQIVIITIEGKDMTSKATRVTPKLDGDYTARNGYDFNFNNADTAFELSNGTKHTINISIDPKKTADLENEFFGITFSHEEYGGNENAQTLIIVLEKKAKKPIGKMQTEFMFLNAFAFDFSKTNVGGNEYVGHLNVFAPTLTDNMHWGINAGIQKINYYTDDSTLSRTNYETQNILPLFKNTIASGDSFEQRIVKKSQRASSSSWSIYAQLTKKLNSNVNLKLFAHAHLELLVNQFRTESKVEVLYSRQTKFDSAFRADNKTPIFQAAYGQETTEELNTATFYYGLGITLLATPWKKGEIFFQYTAGLSSSTYDLKQPDTISNASGIKFLPNGGNSRFADLDRKLVFFLARAYYSHEISNSSKLYVGADIRGFYALKPSYALYAGINLDIDAIIKLIR